MPRQPPPGEGSRWGTLLEPLVDRFGRVHRDLRISLSDRCSLRCTYRMPEQGVPWLQKTTLLSTEELLRRDIVEVVAGMSALDPSPEVSMTTNALALDKTAKALADAGLARANISLDTAGLRHVHDHGPP